MHPGMGEGECRVGGNVLDKRVFTVTEVVPRTFRSCAKGIRMQEEPVQQKTEPAVEHVVGMTKSTFPI